MFLFSNFDFAVAALTLLWIGFYLGVGFADALAALDRWLRRRSTRRTEVFRG
jgi:hypothetical protein